MRSITQKEAEIVAQAGKKGAVTIATNMAGRGTDINLGGNAEYMAKHEMARQGQFEPGKMGFLWLFYGFSTSRSKKPPNLTLRLTSSCHPVLTKQLDVTLLKNKSDETRNNEHSFFRAQNEIVEKR